MLFHNSTRSYCNLLSPQLTLCRHYTLTLIRTLSILNLPQRLPHISFQEFLTRHNQIPLQHQPNHVAQHGHGQYSSNSLPTETYSNPYNTKRFYGAGAIEAADERLKEELKARKSSHAQAASPTPSGPEANAKIELQRSNDELITARQRRKALEVELQQAKDLESALMHKTALCSKRLEIFAA